MEIIDQLKRDEGLRLEPYKDSVGVWTIGYGHNLEVGDKDIPPSIKEEQASLWLLKDVANASYQLDTHLPWTKDLDEARRGVLINMAFNLGIAGLLQFHRTLTMIEAGNYKGAASAMLESKWAQQVGPRAKRLSEQMLTGEWV